MGAVVIPAPPGRPRRAQTSEVDGRLRAAGVRTNRSRGAADRRLFLRVDAVLHYAAPAELVNRPRRVGAPIPPQRSEV